MKKLFLSLVTLGVVFVPAVSFAAGAGLGSIQEIAGTFLAFLDDAVIPLIIGFAVIFFLWGVAKFVKAAGDPKARGEGQQLMLWGIVGLAVMLSVWGLVAIITSTFGFDPVVPRHVPEDI
jgi:hypothetical protein